MPDPGLTQRIAWTPPNTPQRLHITSGGGPQPDLRARRDLLRGIALVVLTLLLLRSLPPSRSHANPPAPAPPVGPQLTQQVAIIPTFEPLPPPIIYKPETKWPGRAYLVQPAVPLLSDE